MHKLKISKIPNGSYFVSDQNDERLSIIGQILTDAQVRNEIKKYLGPVSLGYPRKAHEIKNSKNTQTFKIMEELKDDRYNFLINVNDYPRNNLLETNIDEETLRNLIDTYEDLIGSDEQEIIITRAQDNFEIFHN